MSNSPLLLLFIHYFSLFFNIPTLKLFMLFNINSYLHIISLLYPLIRGSEKSQQPICLGTGCEGTWLKPTPVPQVWLSSLLRTKSTSSAGSAMFPQQLGFDPGLCLLLLLGGGGCLAGMVVEDAFSNTVDRFQASYVAGCCLLWLIPLRHEYLRATAERHCSMSNLYVLNKAASLEP